MPPVARSIPSCPRSTLCRPIRALAEHVHGRVVPTSRTGHRVSFTRFRTPHPVRPHGEPHLAQLGKLPIVLCLVCRSNLNQVGQKEYSECRKKFTSPARRTKPGLPSSKTTPSPRSTTSARTNTPSQAPSTTVK